MSQGRLCVCASHGANGLGVLYVVLESGEACCLRDGERDVLAVNSLCPPGHCGVRPLGVRQ